MTIEEENDSGHYHTIPKPDPKGFVRVGMSETDGNTPTCPSQKSAYHKAVKRKSRERSRRRKKKRLPPNRRLYTPPNDDKYDRGSGSGGSGGGFGSAVVFVAA